MRPQQSRGHTECSWRRTRLLPPLRTRVREGRLDADAVQAVLESGRPSHPEAPRAPRWADHARGRGITAAPRGLSNRDIAEKLTISRKTAGSHIEHIYTKTGVRNRAGASLFAISGTASHDRIANDRVFAR